MLLRRGSISKIKRLRHSSQNSLYDVNQDCRLALKQIQCVDFILALNYLNMEYKQCLAQKEFIQELALLFELDYDQSMSCQGWINHHYLLYHARLQNIDEMKYYLEQELLDSSIHTIISLLNKDRSKIVFIEAVISVGIPVSICILKATIELQAYGCLELLLKTTVVLPELVDYILGSDDSEAIKLLCRNHRITSPKYVRRLLMDSKIEQVRILIEHDAEFDNLCMQLARIKNYMDVYDSMLEKNNDSYSF
jgi:hypothetical protein